MNYFIACPIRKLTITCKSPSTEIIHYTKDLFHFMSHAKTHHHMQFPVPWQKNTIEAAIIKRYEPKFENIEMISVVRFVVGIKEHTLQA